MEKQTGWTGRLYHKGHAMHYVEQTDPKNRHWYVMLNHYPRVLDFQLQRENVRRSEDPNEELPLLEYFIPYCFLEHLTAKTRNLDVASIEHANSLRQDFHDFVFIHATRREIAHLVDSQWNRSMRSRLIHYRDHSGREVTVTEAEKNNLIGIFSELRIRYSFGLPVPDLGPDVSVRIRKEGSFHGQTARIIAVKHTASGISLQLGIPMFGGLKELKLSGLTLEDIQAEETPEDIIGMFFLQDKEEILTDILERRVKHRETEETRKLDATRLNHTFLYSYVSINDPILSARFQALMLICATLRFDRESVKVLTEAVKSQVEGKQAFPPATQAWQYFALYIATRDADYRTAGKQCIQQHPDSLTPTLSRLITSAVNLRGKRKHH